MQTLITHNIDDQEAILKALSDASEEGKLICPFDVQSFTIALQTWLDASIESTTGELDDIYQDDLNSYATGHEAGTLSTLMGIKTLLEVKPQLTR